MIVQSSPRELAEAAIAAASRDAASHQPAVYRPPVNDNDSISAKTRAKLIGAAIGRTMANGGK